MNDQEVVISHDDRRIRVARETSFGHAGHVLIMARTFTPKGDALGICLTREECLTLGTALLEIAMGHERTET